MWLYKAGLKEVVEGEGGRGHYCLLHASLSHLIKRWWLAVSLNQWVKSLARQNWLPLNPSGWFILLSRTGQFNIAI